MMDPGGTPASPLPMLPVGLRDARVLLVDDNELNLRVLRQVLERAGLREVIATQRPRAVLDLIGSRDLDLVVVDLHMPDLDGFGVMELLRPRIDAAGYLPILILTADTTDEARRRALLAGARDFLTKPIDPIEVVLRAGNLLQTRRMYQQLQERADDLERRVRERTAELEAAHIGTVERLARTAEYRDDETGRHVVRVGRTAALVARRLGVDEDTVRLLRMAAPLHDLGKIAIPDALLLAPRKLEPAEFEEIKRHTVIGSSILAGSPSTLLQLADSIALTHHERWDGMGYHGLAGDAIPFASRIVAVADVFDALTHRRPYKEAWPVDRATDEVASGRGTHFDPQVIDAFEELDPAALVDPPEPVDGLDAWGARTTPGPMGPPYPR